MSGDSLSPLRDFDGLRCIHRANCPTCHELVTRFTRAVRLLMPMVEARTYQNAEDIQAVEDLLLPVFGLRTWEQINDD